MKDTNAKEEMSLHDVHKRLQIVEIVVFLSLLLNVVQGYYTMHNHRQMNDIQQETGARP